MTGDFVVLSYVRSASERVHHLLTREAAAEVWARLAPAHRETAMIRDAAVEDVARGQDQWIVDPRALAEAETRDRRARWSAVAAAAREAAAGSAP